MTVHKKEGTTTTEWPAGLTPEWIQYLSDRGVKPEIARQRGYDVLLSGRRKANLGGEFATMHGLGPRGGLYIPLRGLLDPDGAECQLRIENPQPDRNGKLMKFKTPHGQRNVLATHPATIDLLGEPNQRIIIAEGITRVDAAAGYLIPAVGLTGCQNWRGGKPPRAIPDFDALAIRGNRFLLGFDGDITSNPDVHRAAQGLADLLIGKGADAVSTLVLPDGLGLDDWLAREAFANANEVWTELRKYSRAELGTRPARTPSALKKGQGVETVLLGDPTLDEWHRIAGWYAEHKERGRYLYDRLLDEWFEYTAPVWRPMVDGGKRLGDSIVRHHWGMAQELQDAGYLTEATLMGNKREVKSEANNRSGTGLWGGLRIAYDGVLTSPPTHDLATPDGVVDLRTGELRPHAPTDGTRAVTAGRYRPNDAQRLRGRLEAHLQDVLTSEGFASFLTLVGLTVSGRAQSYPGTITLIHGRARTGKGGIVRLVLGALGERGFQVKPEWLDPRKRGDTDATLWLIIFRQPLMIAIDEIGNTQEVSLLRLLDLTGDNQQSARRPFGKEPITGTILCAIWTTAVKSPRLATGTGLGGRLAALQTVRSTPIPEEHRKVGYEQDLLDAVITLGCMEAKRVYEPGYKGPTRDETAYATAVQDMDPVAAWLEALSGEWHGRLVVEALEQCRADTDDPDITDTLFGRRVGVSGRWDKMKPTGRGDSRRVLRLRDDAPLVGVGRKPDPLTRICAMPDCDQPVGPDGQFCTDCGAMGQGRVALGRPSPVTPALRRIAAEGVAILEAEGVETDLIEEAVAVLAGWDSNAELLHRIRPDAALGLSLPTQNAERAASPKIAVLTETMERVMDNLVNGATLGAETPDQLLNGKLQRWWEQLTEVVAEAPAGQQEEVGDGDDAE